MSDEEPALDIAAFRRLKGDDKQHYVRYEWYTVHGSVLSQYRPVGFAEATGAQLLHLHDDGDVCSMWIGFSNQLHARARSAHQLVTEWPLTVQGVIKMPCGDRGEIADNRWLSRGGAPR